MTDMDIAILLIKAAAYADGGCSHCAEQVLDAGMSLHPDLPWKMAAEGLATEHPDEYEYALFSVGSDLVTD